MILYLLNYSQGIVRISVCGAYLERFFNLCACNSINIWNITRIDLDEVYVNILVCDYKRLRKIITNSKCSCKIVSKYGVPFIARKLKKRCAFVFGFFLCAFTYYILTSHLFDIKINGTENTALIYNALYENNVVIGSKLSDIDVKSVQNEIISQNDELLWISINLKGNMATVEVKEREISPELIDKDTPCDIIAEKTGIIESIDVLAGEKMIDVGHTFLKDDILVSCIPKSFPQVEDIFDRQVHSIANIKATIWYNLSRILLKDVTIKNYTGKVHNHYSIVFNKNSINLFKNTSNLYAFYDKIIDIKEINLSDSVVFPIYLKKETYIEYIPEKGQILDETGVSILENNIISCVNNAILGDIIKTRYAEHSNDSKIHIEMNIETLEQIGIKKVRE